MKSGYHAMCTQHTHVVYIYPHKIKHMNIIYHVCIVYVWGKKRLPILTSKW